MPKYYLLIPKDPEEKNTTTLPQAYFIPQSFGNNMFGKDMSRPQFSEKVPDFDPQRFYCVRVYTKKDEPLLNSENGARASRPQRYNSGDEPIELFEPVNITIEAQVMPDKSEKSKTQINRDFDAILTRSPPTVKSQMLHVEMVAALKTAKNMEHQTDYLNTSYIHRDYKAKDAKIIEINTYRMEVESIAGHFMKKETDQQLESQGVAIRAKQIIGSAQKKLLSLFDSKSEKEKAHGHKSHMHHGKRGGG